LDEDIMRGARVARQYVRTPSDPKFEDAIGDGFESLDLRGLTDDQLAAEMQLREWGGFKKSNTYWK